MARRFTSRLQSPAPVNTFTYATTSGTNRLASVTASSPAGTRAITYDARGNTASESRVSGVTAALACDGYGRLTSYTRTGDPGQANVYNGMDDRVAVTTTGVGADTRRYLYDEDGRTLGEYGASALDVKAETIWLSPEVATANQPFGGDDSIGGYAPLAVAADSGVNTIAIKAETHGNLTILWRFGHLC